MTTTDQAGTTQKVADRFYQLAQEGKWDDIQAELYSENAESIEPQIGKEYGLNNAKGQKELKKKAEDFNQNVEAMHGGYCSQPVVAGNHFSCAMGMDVTMKGAGRVNMDEIAVYEVKDGKIIKEQFFY
jgi:SnoaL-like protein